MSMIEQAFLRDEQLDVRAFGWSGRHSAHVAHAASTGTTIQVAASISKSDPRGGDRTAPIPVD